MRQRREEPRRQDWVAPADATGRAGGHSFPHLFFHRIGVIESVRGGSRSDRMRSAPDRPRRERCHICPLKITVSSATCTLRR